MTTSPHPVTITVYDVDGTTLMSGAKVLIRNCTKKTTIETEETTNSSGIALIDLANLPLASGQTVEYETGDEVLIIAHHGGDHAHIGAKYVVTGSSKTQTLYLKEVPYTGNSVTERIMSVCASNTDGTNPYYVKIHSFDDCQLLSHIEVPKGDTKNIVYGGRGIQGKAIFEIENKAIMVTANFR